MKLHCYIFNVYITLQHSRSKRNSCTFEFIVNIISRSINIETNRLNKTILPVKIYVNIHIYPKVNKYKKEDKMTNVRLFKRENYRYS